MILEEIRTTVENKTNLNITRNCSKQAYVTARYIYMALAYKFTKETLNSIGTFVGRDHSTVIYALDTLDNRLHYEKDMKIIHDDLMEYFGTMYSGKARSEQYVKIKSQNRQRKKILRMVNSMTDSELTKLESILSN